MEKYYTPEIEEFHIGFEYEIQHIDTNDWESCTFTNDDFDWAAMDKEYMSLFRVKYLDKEDIESLGFKLTSGDVNKRYDIPFNSLEYYKKDNIQIELELEYDLESPNLIRITIYDADSIPNTVVSGIAIKNKSELKRLLKQLQIE